MEPVALAVVFSIAVLAAIAGVRWAIERRTHLASTRMTIRSMRPFRSSNTNARAPSATAIPDDVWLSSAEQSMVVDEPMAGEPPVLDDEWWAMEHPQAAQATADESQSWASAQPVAAEELLEAEPGPAIAKHDGETPRAEPFDASRWIFANIDAVSTGPLGAAPENEPSPSPIVRWPRSTESTEQPTTVQQHQADEPSSALQWHTDAGHPVPALDPDRSQSVSSLVTAGAQPTSDAGFSDWSRKRAVIAYCRELHEPGLAEKLVNQSLARAVPPNDGQELLRITRETVANHASEELAPGALFAAEREDGCPSMAVLLRERGVDRLNAEKPSEGEQHLHGCLRCQALTLRIDRAERAFATELGGSRVLSAAIDQAESSSQEGPPS